MFFQIDRLERGDQQIEIKIESLSRFKTPGTAVCIDTGRFLVVG